MQTSQTVEGLAATVARLEAQLADLARQVTAASSHGDAFGPSGRASNGTTPSVSSAPLSPATIPPPGSIVRLNVGGKHFTTALSTLVKYPESMLGSMFSGRYPLMSDREGVIFIDRDPKPFAHVLSFLRTGRWYLPDDDGVLLDQIRGEAEFFNLPWIDDEEDSFAEVEPVKTLAVPDAGETYTVVVCGDYLVSGSNDGGLRVWDQSTGNVVKESHEHEESLTHLAFDESRRLLASLGDDQTIVVYDLPGLNVQEVIEPEHEDPYCITFWAGRLVCCFDEAEEIHVYGANFQVDTRLSQHTDTVNVLAVWKHPTAGEELLVSGSDDRRIRAWNTKMQCVAVLTGHTDSVQCLTQWRDLLVSGAEDSSIRLWTANYECKQVLRGHTSALGCLTVWRDYLVSYGDDDFIRLWSPDGQLRRSIEQMNEGTIYTLEVWKDKLVAASDRHIRLWDFQSRE